MLKWIILLSIILIIYYFPTKKYKYSEIENYEYDDVAKSILDESIKKTKKPKNTRERLESNYIAGSVLEHNVAPNSDNVAEILELADRHYAEALAAIIDEPALETFETPGVQTIIDHIEDFRLRPLPEVRAKVRKERIGGDYFKKQQIHSDPQNVHDSNVSHTMAMKFNKIRNLDTHSLEDLESELKAHKFGSPKRREEALSAFYLMCRGARITNLNSTEDDVVRAVWSRVNHPDNKKRKNNMKGIFFDSLASVYENGKPVCINGRCSRVIDSLTLIDTDKSISAPAKTAEILRSEVMAKAYTVIQNELKSAPKKTRDAYNGITKDSTIKFEESTKKKIESIIREDYPDAKPRILDPLIEDAKAGV